MPAVTIPTVVTIHCMPAVTSAAPPSAPPAPSTSNIDGGLVGISTMGKGISTGEAKGEAKGELPIVPIPSMTSAIAVACGVTAPLVPFLCGL
jgi:hypothetical protein